MAFFVVTTVKTSNLTFAGYVSCSGWSEGRKCIIIVDLAYATKKVHENQIQGDLSGTHQLLVHADVNM
jgi:hypothetical protein